MELDYTHEQKALRQSLQTRFADAREAQPLGKWDAAVWIDFVDLNGILRIGLPSRIGGTGGPVETMIVMEELGVALLADAYLETLVVAAQLLAQSPDARFDNLLSRVAAGNALIAVAWGDPGQRHEEDCSLVATSAGAGWRLNGRRSMVIGAAAAEHWIVEARTPDPAGGKGETMLFLLERDSLGISRFDYPTIDGRSASDLKFEAVSVGMDQLIADPGATRPLIDSVINAAIAAHCAEAVGVMRRMLADTVRHCKERRQFGQPLSSFQALQHRMIDMNLHIEMAASATLRATLSLDRPFAERTRATSAAKVTVAGACRFVGQNAIQLHGGLGMRDDTPVTRYFRRATAMESEFGSVDWHLSRFASYDPA